MKQLLRLLAILSLATAASCGHSVPSPLPAIQATLGIARADSRPRTVHVIPFYDYGSPVIHCRVGREALSSVTQRPYMVPP